MKRALALLLCLSLPADAAVRVRAAPVVKAPVAAAAVPLLAPAVPTLAPAAAPPAPASITPAPAAAVSPQLQAVQMAELPQLAAASFDGSKTPQTAPVAGAESRGPAHLPPSAPEPKKKAPSAVNAFKNAMGVTVAAAIAVPILYGSVPLHYAIYSLAASMSLPAFALAVSYGVRAARALLHKKKAAPKPSAPRALRTARLAGVAVGLALTLAGQVIKPAAVEAGAHLFVPAKQVRLVQGQSALQDEIRKVLSGNAVGREVLDGLRDRGGVVRMPTFYVSESESAAATYVSAIDAVFISRSEIRVTGVTVEEFLSDPAKQRAFVHEFYSTFLHELRHAGQFRRGLTFSGHFEFAMDTEYEAYLTEVAFTHAALKANPHDNRIIGHELWDYEQALDDVHGWLKELDEAYPRNKKSRSLYWKKFFQKFDADWPAVRVEGYTLLAQRAKHQRDKDAYMEKARKAAEQLP